MARRQKLTGSGNVGSLNANKDYDVSEHDDSLIFIAGTFVGTISFLASDDGTNFVPIQGFPLDSSTPVTSVTAPGKGYKFDTSGLKTLRLNMSAYTSGTVNSRLAGLTR